MLNVLSTFRHVRSAHDMEVLFAENHQLSSTLCSDGCDEQLSSPSDAALCGISVHQNRHTTEIGVVEKCDENVADSQEHFNPSLTSRHVVTEDSKLSVLSEVIPCTLPAVSYTGAADSCVAEDNHSACTTDCTQSVSDVTAELASCYIDAAQPSTELAEVQCILRPKSLSSAKKSVCFPVDNADALVDDAAGHGGKCAVKPESQRVSLLLRLFESKLFDMAIALPYLFNSKEPGVLAYLGQ